MSMQIDKSEGEGERNSSQMLSFSKMLAVLDCFSRDDRSLSVLEIARRTKLPRTTVHRSWGRSVRLA